MEAANHLEHLGQLHDRVRQWQPWVRSLAEVADNLGVDPSRGLDRLDALSRQRRFGPNVPVDLSQNLGFFKVFMEEIAEPMMLLLLSVGVLYSIWGEPWDAATIFVTILVVIGLEVFTEWRAKRALASLMNSVPTNTSVLRDGREGVVAADELVPGDVLLLAHGQSVPADAVVAVCHGFSVDESMLTGESDDGFPNYDELQEIPPTLVCAGTTVTSGRAVCIVVATGSHTEIAANIARLMKGGKPPPTPLQRRMKKLAGSLSLVAIAVCVLITLVGLLKGMEWRTAILMGMSLAFATIPEELPLIAKASLALGARQLARHKLLVRRLTAADALASVSVIVTDKTGTLTRNQLVVSSVLTISSDGSDGDALAVEVITPEAISASENLLGAEDSDSGDLELPRDPATDNIPLLTIAESISIVCERLPEPSGELPFDATLRISARTRSPAKKHWTVVKGAPETLLPMCDRVWKTTATGVPMSESFSQTVSRSATKLAVGGSRLPGGAATLDRGASAQQALPTDLVFVGAFAFFDPPQREAKPVLQECQDAGIRVIMATGDHPSTALAVANAVGITEGHAPPDPSSGPHEIHAVTGEMVQKSLSNGTFEQLIDESNVFARVTPAQKLRLVHSLQARGEVVAFIGDGINDAPSLTRADVGICMGGNPSTADVAMDSASLIVLSGKFSGVVRSLREGHRLSANIDKCLVFYIACKLAIVALFAFLLIVEGASPMTPVQVIFIELFTD
ncbi:calcium ATPase, partial [Martensiomyces pterosporus]